jgi:DNA ligase (NAD+)
MIDKLRAAEVNLQGQRTGARQGVLSGLIFVVTGRLERFSRDEAESLIKRNGGAATSSITKKTDYLVVGAEAGSKLEKAQKLGTTLLAEDEFIALLRERRADGIP